MSELLHLDELNPETVIFDPYNFSEIGNVFRCTLLEAQAKKLEGKRITRLLTGIEINNLFELIKRYPDANRITVYSHEGFMPPDQPSHRRAQISYVEGSKLKDSTWVIKVGCTTANVRYTKETTSIDGIDISSYLAFRRKVIKQAYENKRLPDLRG